MFAHQLCVASFFVVHLSSASKTTTHSLLPHPPTFRIYINKILPYNVSSKMFQNHIGFCTWIYYRASYLCAKINECYRHIVLNNLKIGRYYHTIFQVKCFKTIHDFARKYIIGHHTCVPKSISARANCSEKSQKIGRNKTRVKFTF